MTTRTSDYEVLQSLWYHSKSDGSEGDCLKLGKEVASAVEAITTETVKLNLEEDTGYDGDPFASDVEANLEEAEAVLKDE